MHRESCIREARKHFSQHKHRALARDCARVRQQERPR
jgi:hypothetical protein